MATSKGGTDPVAEEDRVQIFDTTLRDGEQSPGISLNTQEKVEIAQQLARLGVDVIEAGFPITSPGDFEAVEAIAHGVEGPVVCGLARTHKADIDAAWGAIKDAPRSRIHTFISTSDIHITHQLQTTREDVKGQAKAAVALARSYCDDVEFSPMDATRADVEFTAEVCGIAIAEGAGVINIPDTVGYTTPEEYRRYFERLYELVPELRDVRVSVHCHDDLGLAVANSYAGVLGKRIKAAQRITLGREEYNGWVALVLLIIWLAGITLFIPFAWGYMQSELNKVWRDPNVTDPLAPGLPHPGAATAGLSAPLPATAQPAPGTTPPQQPVAAPQEPAAAQQPVADAPQETATTEQQPVATAQEPLTAQQDAPAAAPADWYPDPTGRARLRYWDGASWTQHTAQ